MKMNQGIRIIVIGNRKELNEMFQLFFQEKVIIPFILSFFKLVDKD